MFARGKMNNAKTLSSAHLQLKTKRYSQKTSTVVVTIEISTFNKYRTAFCTNC